MLRGGITEKDGCDKLYVSHATEELRKYVSVCRKDDITFRSGQENHL